MAVPLFDTKTPLAPLRAEIDAKIAEVVDRGTFILGPEVAAFEAEFAAYLGARHAAGVANGTDALVLALRALGVGPGDDVVVPSFTFYASAEAIPLTGARPVFCDVDPGTCNVTAETVRAALTPRTKAVIAVHLFGNVAPIAEIEALGVPVVEDAAQAAGSLAADGRRPARSARSRPSRSSRRRTSARSATAAPSRPTTRRWRARAHAALPRLARQGHVRARRPQLAARRAAGGDPARRSCRTSTHGATAAAPAPRHYERAGLGELVELPAPPPAAIRRGTCTSCATRRSTRSPRGCAPPGIGHKVYYRVPAHRQPAMRRVGAASSCPSPTRLARTHLAIPMSPVLTEEQAAEVVSAVRSARLQHQ